MGRVVNGNKRKVRGIRCHTNSWLIVCGGTETEPKYFEALRQKIHEHRKGRIDVKPGPSISIHPDRLAPVDLIKKTARFLNQSNHVYQNVWLVIDRDSFVDFDQTIDQAKAKGWEVAWSNACFEYWLYLHFCDTTGERSAQEWEQLLEKKVLKVSDGRKHYKKSNPDNYEIVHAYGNEADAIRRANAQYDKFVSEQLLPSQINPCTCVQCLVSRLNLYMQ